MQKRCNAACGRQRRQRQRIWNWFDLAAKTKASKWRQNRRPSAAENVDPQTLANLHAPRRDAKLLTSLHFPCACMSVCKCVCVCWSGLCGTWPTSMWCDRIRSLLVAQRRLLIDATATCRMQQAVNKKRKSIVRTKTAANALSQLGVTPVHRQHAPCRMPHPACRMPAPSRPSTVCQVDRQMGNGWHCINLSINVAINIKSSPLAYSLCALISHKCSACGKASDALQRVSIGFSLIWSLSMIVIAAEQIYDINFLRVSIDLYFSSNLRQFRNSRVQREAHTLVWHLLSSETKTSVPRQSAFSSRK